MKKVVMYTLSTCPWCMRAKKFFREHDIPFEYTDYDKADDSATDFAYVLALLRRGFSQAEIAQRIISERKNWANHNSPKKMKDYLNRTISKATIMVKQITR